MYNKLNRIIIILLHIPSDICNTNALADKPKNDSDDKYETRFSFDGFEDNENGSGSSIEKSTQEKYDKVLPCLDPEDQLKKWTIQPNETNNPLNFYEKV